MASISAKRVFLILKNESFGTSVERGIRETAVNLATAILHSIVVARTEHEREEEEEEKNDHRRQQK
ncbi:MAG TPA: hypothetical protein VNI77_09800 [Nitrososphaera sp.]|nr:hypothetical protein [Nitrososphaera sp.]